jgi:serine protease Do
MGKLLLSAGLLLVAAGWLPAQDRDTKVRNDRKTFQGSNDWIYNDLDEGIRAARAAGKPLFVVLRCIPCEACQEFDDDVARRDPIIRDMLDQYVCVRIVQANALDLTHFQDDFDQSFAVFLLNPDMTLYGRFGTRSERPEEQDISLEGLRKAMAEGLRIHRAYPAVKPMLAGKQPKPVRFKTPLEYPSLAGKYQATINYNENTARSCLHCHQIRDAERQFYRTSREPIPDEVLFPYPDPGVLGLTMDCDELATISRVDAGSLAERAGLEAGDAIVTLAGQPLLSVADLQWVLQDTPATARLAATVRHDGRTRDLTLDLPEGWRRRGDISWRTSTWDLRRMGLGGMALVELSDEERRQAKLPAAGMALRAKHVGEFGDHAVAKRAGFRKGDILIAFDGRDDLLSETQLLAYTLQRKLPGDVVAVTILRDGERKTLSFAQQ